MQVFVWLIHLAESHQRKVITRMADYIGIWVFKDRLGMEKVHNKAT
jgi:hypothetical protein